MTTCRTCPRELSRRNASGYCRSCNGHVVGVNPDRIARIRATITQPHRLHRTRAHAARASRSRLAWCPMEYRPDYRVLTRVKMLPAAEARAAIVAQVDADRRALGRLG